MTNMTPTSLYHYRAYVTRVHSGDTCQVDIDLGLGVWSHSEEIRLHQIEAPNGQGNSKAAATASRDYLTNLVLDHVVLLHTVKDRSNKTCRFLGEMIVFTEQGERIDVNAAMVKSGHAQKLPA